jgi:hypothetical protein
MAAKKSVRFAFHWEEYKDYHLSRFACYLIAQNGDPRKPEVVAAQAYFAVSTQKMSFMNCIRRSRSGSQLA